MLLTVSLKQLMHEIMVRPLPPGCRLTALFDSCHSGSILDLPYLYHSNGRQKGSDVTAAFRKQRMTPADVITWSGSADNQTSADTVQNGLAVGAMSHAFVKILSACSAYHPRGGDGDLLNLQKRIRTSATRIC